MMSNQLLVSLSFMRDYSTMEKAIMDCCHLTRSSIKKIINEKKFLKMKVYAKKEYKLNINLVNRGYISPDYNYPSMKILYEDDLFVVLNKISGIHSHPLKYTESDNCLSFMRKNNYSDILSINKSSYDRGLLYRLDKVTSGVIIFVKNESLYQNLRLNYSKIAKKKKYLAIVEGCLGVDKKLNHYFRSSERKGRKIQVSDTELPNTKCGRCIIRPISYNEDEDITLIEVNLETGLRHQIRSQLAYVGYPIRGDYLYGGKSAKRVFLHAYNYQIKTEQVDLDIVCKDADLFDVFFDLDTCL